MTVILTLLALGVIIAVHELGHFLAARLAGIRVAEYAIGMGPALARIKRGETMYTIRLLIPIGGFVRMVGMHPDESEAGEEGAFLRQPVKKRMGVIVAGSLMNLVLAVFLFTIVYGVIGLTTFDLTLSEVRHDMPAAAAGIEVGDRVVAVDGQDVDTWQEFAGIIYESPGEPVTISVARQGQLREVTVTPSPSEEGIGLIGVAPTRVRARSPLHLAMFRGFADTAVTIGLWVTVIVLMISGRMEGEIIGPIGAGQFIGQAAAIGPDIMLLVVAQISVMVGLANLLPIPVFDGSKLVFLAIEGIRGRPVNQRFEYGFHFVGFFLLIMLAVFIAYRDIVRLWSG